MEKGTDRLSGAAGTAGKTSGPGVVVTGGAGGAGTARPGMSRRTFLKTGLKAVGGLLGLAALGGGYVTEVEPRWLETVRTRLSPDGLPPAFEGMKIAHFSDVHYEFHFGPGRLKKLVKRIMAEEPDMICFTGDLVNRGIYEAGDEIASILGELQAPLGKFAVLGNHDYYHKVTEVADTLVRAGFQCLRNQSVIVKRGNGFIRVSGVEDSNRGRPKLDDALGSIQKGEFVLLLAHTPDFASRAMQYPVALQLSGHSHGGQVRIPFRGPVVRVPGAKLYPDGLHRPGDGKLLLYTNRGVGVTGMPVRFWCRPELTIHTLV